MAKQLTVYSLSELKDQFPDAYDAVLERWQQSVALDTTPWIDETMRSLKAVISVCGGDLRDWSISAYDACSYIKVRVNDEWEDDNGEEHVKDAAWLLANVLVPNGYVKDGAADFPGHCKFTGYCADDGFLESVYKDMVSGDTLTAALENLASVASRLVEDDLEQMQDEESMMANWGDSDFLPDGTMV